MKVIIIGTGNVATVLSKLCKTAGHDILQVYGRNSDAAASLALHLHAAPCNNWNEIHTDGDIYIAAVSDAALTEMATKLILPGRLIVHTAGSVSMHVLKPISSRYGILYPLQSIRKELPPGASIPLLVDGNSEDVKTVVQALASQLSANVVLTTDEERVRLHIAAVMVNNFTNHLYQLAEAFCEKEALDFKLLLPLIQETANRIEQISARKSLTGPALRKDQLTINKHLQLLESYPAIKQVYEQLTASIQQFNT